MLHDWNDCTLYLDVLENGNKFTPYENGIMENIRVKYKNLRSTEACLWKSSFIPHQVYGNYFLES